MDSPLPDLVHRFPHEAMGTLYEVMIAGHDEAYSREAARAAFEEVDRLERLFSRFNASSEIGQINRLEPGAVLRIGWETYECLATAERIRHETGGAFDINFRARGRGRQEPGPAAARGTAETRPAASVDTPVSQSAGAPAYELFPVPGGFALRASQGPQAGGAVRPLDLDLGAIGKGCALDRAAAVLEEWSVDNFLMHAGTSTALAKGSAPATAEVAGVGVEAGWPVGVGGVWELPGRDKRVFLRNRALSGSGTEIKGQHIKDPGTGEAAAAHLAAWASHPQAAFADALSTAFMIMPTDEVERYCLAHPDVWALVITPDAKGHDFNPGVLTA